MDTYSIEPDYHEGYQAKVVRENGIAHSAHGFASRCDAQKWLNEHRRINRATENQGPT